MKKIKSLIFILVLIMLLISTTSAQSIDYGDAWKVGLKLFKKGTQGSDAIYPVYQATTPGPSAMQATFNVIGAIWGDTWWNTTTLRLDPEILATAMNAAMGWGIDDCLNVAKKTFSLWWGIHLRNSTADDGHIPTSTNVTQSPDIVCNGTQKLHAKQILDNWNNPFWNLAVDHRNYVYVRARSTRVPFVIPKATVKMWYAEGGMNIPISEWVPIPTWSGGNEIPLKTVDGKNLGKSDYGCTIEGEAFNFQPSSKGHYCLIAIVSSTFLTNSQDALQNPSNINYTTWLQYNGASAWHNVNYAPPSQVNTLAIYNQDNRPEYFAFEAHCHNLPVGTKVSLECTDPKLEHPIKSNVHKITKKYHKVSTVGKLPPSYKGKLTVNIKTLNGKPIPPKSRVKVKMLWLVNHGHRHYYNGAAVMKAFEKVSKSQEIRLPMGDFTFKGKK